MSGSGIDQNLRTCVKCSYADRLSLLLTRILINRFTYGRSMDRSWALLKDKKIVFFNNHGLRVKVVLR